MYSYSDSTIIADEYSRPSLYHSSAVEPSVNQFSNILNVFLYCRFFCTNDSVSGLIWETEKHLKLMWQKHSNQYIFGACPFLLNKSHHLVEALGFSHGALDVEGTHVLPVLFEQWHQEVDGQVDVVHQLIFCHLDVSDGHGQTEHL